MKTFLEFLEESKNLHMEHLEDLVFLRGIEGTRQAIEFLRGLRDMLGGQGSGPEVTMKWDGCVHKNTPILTNQGNMEISKIIEKHNNGENIQVMGKDLEETGHDLYTDIIGTSIAEPTKEWVEIELEDGTVLKTTDDHEFHTSNRGWIEAKNLSEEDDITELNFR